MSDLRARFAAGIKVARQAAGLTQEELADASGSSVDFIFKMERGLNSPSLETLAALVHALALDPSRVLQAANDARTLTPERRELEARVALIARGLDDRALSAFIEVGHTLERLRAEPTVRSSGEK